MDIITPLKNPKPKQHQQSKVNGVAEQQIDSSSCTEHILSSHHQLEPQQSMDTITPIVYYANEDDDILEPSFEIYGSMDSQQAFFDDLIITEQSTSDLHGGSIQREGVEFSKTPCHQNHRDGDQLPAATVTAIATSVGKNQESSSTPITLDTATSTPTRLDQLLCTSATAAEPMIPSAEAQSVTSSITDSNLTDMTTFQRAYKLYKQQGKNENSTLCLPMIINDSGPLQDIIEGVQLCTMMCMAELFDDSTTKDDNEKRKVVSKVDRIEETNNSFLGKMIQCGGVVEGGCVGGGGGDEWSVLGEDDRYNRKG